MSRYGTYDKRLILEGAAVAVNAAAGINAKTLEAAVPMMVLGFQVRVTIAVNYDTQTAAQILSVCRRPTPGSAAGEVELAEIEVKQGWAANQIYRKKIDAVNLAAGEQLIIRQKQQGAGGGGLAGEAIPQVLGCERAEVAANQPWLNLLN